MPILNIQVTMRQLGRIRMGNQVAASNGKKRPNKLETWRLTSPFDTSLQAAAEMYGGEVTVWEGAPGGVKQFELYTEAQSIEILIPPSEMSFSQWMETWSGGGCSRRCDQVTEQLSGEPCMCPQDKEERMVLAAKGQACKPTTRLSVLQPRLPDIGLWRLDVHGWYGAIELAGTIDMLQRIQSTSGLVPARLTIDQRQTKRDGQTINYAVPVIELPTLSTHTLMTGEIPDRGELGRPVLREIGAGAGPDRAPDGDEPVGDTRPTPQEPPAPAARRTHSAGEKLHRELGRMGIKDKTEHEELIFNASGGRTVHAAELDEKELVVVTAMAADVTGGRLAWSKIIEANDAHRAAQQVEEVGRPLPGPGTGDGSKFRRAILTKAQRSGLDGDALDELALSVIGKPFEKIDNSDDANKLLAAV